ncbi:glycoside hydrolase family 17 protein [Pseudothauera rhizosphaerae]|uniref:Endo-1,3-beta-glucanase btgC n=1 Tax=Pseudothauera rhizosphaerae TaxID=2565932 RepID=A0A4S4AU51_9RHOO|nr:beta-1,6-glucan synthase [Pseudothauera rhizosphaerae]THF63418.1 beta-1,6-glucan synthase [Pseudothauera rhizosphaerae]
MRRYFDSPSTRWRILLAANLAALAGLLAWLAWQSRPVAMHDLHLAEGEKLQCVSYAPFHLPGQTPFDPELRIPRTQIAADLAALAKITACVRLYSIDQGLDAVPELARDLGLKVMLGAWIGRDKTKNAVELDRAIQLANDNADVVDVLIVGNEVLLRRERTQAEMRELLAYARARVRVPVTYADVWEFWLKNRELAAEVDRVTVHILPFWEDEPVHIDHAVSHVTAVLEEVRRAFDKPVTIGETGWPSAGRQREESLPSRVNQARYVREFVHQAHAEGWRYNLIEAIDQPWKRNLEGTVGGYWGMLDPALAPKFPLAGPVSERTGWVLPSAAMLAGALLCLGLAHGVRAGGLQRLGAAAGGAMGGLVAVLHGEHALLAYRNALEWSVLGGVGLAATLLPLILARWRGDGIVPAAGAAWRSLRGGRASLSQAIPFALSLSKGGCRKRASTSSARTGRCVFNDPLLLLGLLRGVLLFAAAIAALLLAVDPRYRDFPLALYLIPALHLGLLGVLAAGNGNEERVCGAIIVVATIARWSSEPANPQALAWLATGLALGLPALFGRRAGQGQ